ncbi:glycosyltransferase family 4 protein [Candidatus Nitrosacidococcus tergens]|uniref:Glycosyl transferase, group 1 n=1 Tax=Candidatus Nitrosacidococcus tergens TaxID=553981 RepID=A0A7G1QAX7_9GAMM|nr:glycosyltransferase family 4 protein [Candidatus Nitrosacidococcus tergens]CAB1276751.1 Glycosyl transferase, group 1 [Candidatus Nitrosacidococcus tergens]
MKILVLCDRFPFPLQNGQNLRIYHYVTHLSKKHQFDLVCYGDNEIPFPLRKLFHKIKIFPNPRLTLKKERSSLIDLKGKFSIVSYKSQKMTSWLQENMSCQNYDLLWMSGVGAAANLPKVKKLPFLADIIDSGLLTYWRSLRTAPTLEKKIRTGKRLIQEVIFEYSYFNKADSSIVVSELDARYLRWSCPQVPISTLHNGVDENYFFPDFKKTDPATIIFEGSMEFPPNVDAACFLVQDILPHIEIEIPDIRVLLVGRDPTPAVLALAKSNVTVTGFVEDIRPYLTQATVFVCPMRTGAGIKNKLLQAWSMGKPIIASPSAIGGLFVQEGENILIRSGAKEIANAIVKVIKDKVLHQKLAEEGRKTICMHYTWEQKSKELDSIFHFTVNTFHQK